MKRLALLSVVALMLASAVFAPVALAQELGEIAVQSVTLGPGGSLTATGTIQCNADDYYEAIVDVRQKSNGNVYNKITLGAGGQCNGAGPTEFTASGFSDKPFHKGKATLQAHGILQNPDPNNPFTEADWYGGIESIHIR